MLFEMNKRKFESEKERNLYFKFFAGFYFNELVSWHSTQLDGYSERLKDFYRLLKRPALRVGNDVMAEVQSPDKGVFVSFDNHIDRHHNSLRGEFADILIHDQSKKLLVGVEAKYLDNWDYKKDIVENGKKLASMRRKLKAQESLLCLLVTETKWTNVKEQRFQKNSNYAKLKRHTGSQVVVILWEDLISRGGVHPIVRNYMADQLQKI